MDLRHARTESCPGAIIGRDLPAVLAALLAGDADALWTPQRNPKRHTSILDESESLAGFRKSRLSLADSLILYPSV